MIVAREFSGFAAGAVLLGAGTAMVYPTLLAAIGDVAHPTWRASSVGVYRLWRDLGYAIGALLAGITADALGIGAYYEYVRASAENRMSRILPLNHDTRFWRTPMLIFFGDKDGTVDFRQGVEMYNYARRAGKQLVMLVYANEDHSAREKPNQIDYHRRILQWFGHYLKGDAAPAWITQGLTVIEAEKAAKTR